MGLRAHAGHSTAIYVNIHHSMKYIFLSLFGLLLFACSNDPRKDMPPTGDFGASFSADSVMTVSEALFRLSTQNEFEAVVTGTIQEYCKGEGCWLTLQNPSGEPLFVEVENKLFVLPHHIEGKTAVVKGRVSQTTNDAGKTEPLITASGISIR